METILKCKLLTLKRRSVSRLLLLAVLVAARWLDGGAPLVAEESPSSAASPSRFPPDVPITLDLEYADLEETLRNFAAVIDASLVLASAMISDETDEANVVTLQLENIPWSEALDAVCEQANCTWELSGQLSGEAKPVLEIRRRILSRHPDGRSNSPEVMLRFYPSPTGRALRGVARFTGTAPQRSLLTRDGDRFLRIELTWLPFAAEKQALLPLWTRCDPRGRKDEILLLDPIALPPEKPSLMQHGESLLQISKVPETDETPLLGDEFCPGAREAPFHAAQFHASLKDVVSGAEIAEIVFDRLLLVTPPAEKNPTAAVLFAGFDPSERPILVFVGASKPRRLKIESETIEVLSLTGAEGSYRLHIRATSKTSGE